MKEKGLEMKKIKYLLCALLLVTMVSACGSGGSDEKSTTVCSGVIDGLEETMTLKADGDKLVTQKESITYSFADLGVTKDQLDMESFMQLLMNQIFNTDEVKGVKASYETTDTDLTILLTIDYTKVDLDILEEAGIIESGWLTTKYISLERTVEGLEDTGYTCKK